MSENSSETTTEKKAAEQAKSKAAHAKAQKDAHVREQLTILMSASFCTRPHPDRPPRPTTLPVPSKALEERIEGAIVYEGARDCAECQRKLMPMSAALLLAVLPPTATPKLLPAARALRSEQPMTWAAILQQNTVRLAQVVARTKGAAFTFTEYQTMANEMLATLQPPRPS